MVWLNCETDRQTDRLGPRVRETGREKETRKGGKGEREILFPVRIPSNNLIYGAILENVLFIFMKGLIDAAASFNKLL